MMMYGVPFRQIVIVKSRSKMDELAVEVRADNQAYYKVKYTSFSLEFVLLPLAKLRRTTRK